MSSGRRELAPQTVKYAAIAATASGTRTIVAAVAGKKICLLHYIAGSTGNTTFKWQSFDGGSGYTDLSGAIPPRASGDSTCEASYNPDGHFETVSGEALVMVVGGNDVAGHLTYIEV